MDLQKGFLKQNRYKPKTTKRRLIFASIISICFAVSFYSFLYVFREILRVLSVNDFHDVWLLSDKAVSFYNLFYAFLSLIFAQSVFILIAYNKPRGIQKGRRYYRFSILSDQRVLNLYFLDWFAKMAILYWMLFGDIMDSGYMTFRIFPNYVFMFVLMLVFLFFQTWITLRRFLGRPGLKWMFISFAVIVLSSFALSRYNPVNYKAINQTILSHNAFVVHDIELPETDDEVRSVSKIWVERLFVVEPDSSADSFPVLLLNDQQISAQELHEYIIAMRSMYGEWESPRLTIQIIADKDLPMRYLNAVREILIQTGALRVVYAVVPETRDYPKAYYRGKGIYSKLPPYTIDTCVQQQLDELKEFSQIIHVYPFKDVSVVNDSLISLDQFKSYVMSEIYKNPDYAIVLHVSGNLRYADYIRHYAAIQSAVHDLREFEAQKQYGKSIDDIYWADADEIMKMYAMRVVYMSSNSQ